MTIREEKVASITKSLKNYINDGTGMFTTIVPKALLGDAMRELESHAAQSQQVRVELFGYCYRGPNGGWIFVEPSEYEAIREYDAITPVFTTKIAGLIEGAGK